MPHLIKKSWTVSSDEPSKKHWLSVELTRLTIFPLLRPVVDIAELSDWSSDLIPAQPSLPYGANLEPK